MCGRKYVRFHGISGSATLEDGVKYVRFHVSAFDPNLKQ